MRKILVVEDDTALSGAIEAKLKASNFSVIVAGNGREGLALALQDRPDIILLDLIMPDMDGLEMLQQLRQDDWGRTAKVIIMSNLTVSEMTAKALEYGVHDYLVKSDWKLEDIVNKINERLEE